MPRLLSPPSVSLAFLVVGGCIFITADDVAERDLLLHPVVPPGGVAVQVLDDGVPLTGATVTVDGETLGATDAAGWVSAEIEEGRHVVEASLSGRPSVGTTVEVLPAHRYPVVLSMTRPSTGTVHRPSTGGAIAKDHEYALVFDGGAFTGAAEAPIQVSYSWIPPGSGAAPPPWMADAQGTPAPVDLAAVAWVGSGSASGTTFPFEGSGSIRLPAATGNPLRALVDPKVYHFDPAQGLWVTTASAALEASYLTGAIAGEGWWAIGSDDGLGCVEGELGSDAGGALVRMIDPTRPVPPTAWADEGGVFCVAAPVGHGGTLQTVATSGDGATWKQGEVEVSAPSRVAECGDECVALGSVALETLADTDGDTFRGGIGGDCDDGDDGVAPGVVDLPGDGVDQDCDGTDGEDGDHDGSDASTDCDDADPSRGLGLPEVCDGRDNDCDTRVDRGVDHAVDFEEGGCASCDAQTAIDLGPKLYWSFREGGTVVADDSGYGNDGEAFGIDETWSINSDDVPAPHLGGNIGSGMKLLDFQDIATDVVTVSVFLRPTITRRFVVSYATPPVAGEDPKCHANEFALQLSPGSVKLRMFDFAATIPGVESLDAWEHLVVTWRSSGQIVAYKNGDKVYDGELTTENRTYNCPEFTTTTPTKGTFPVVQTTIAKGGSLYVGQDQDCVDGCIDSEQSYEGAVDELMIFDRALTEREIRTLYEAVTCGEGLTCDDVDADGDGQADEHLIGSDGSRCVAATCQDIIDTESNHGDGLYYLEGDPDPVDCTFPDEGTCSCRLCGDGVVADGFETCETGDTMCNDCAIDSVSLPDCAAIAENAGARSLVDGVYWIYPDGAPLKVRCSFNEDGGNWTQVMNQDTRYGNVFYDPYDPDTWAGGSAQGLSDWRSAHTDDPFHGAYSILGHLDTLARVIPGDACYEFRMTWPFDTTSPLLWRQTSNPTTEYAVTGFQQVGGPTFDDPDFLGLRLGYGDAHPQPNYIHSDVDPKRLYATSLMNSGWDDALQANWFAMGVYVLGAARNRTWKLWTSPDVSVDGTSRGSQLWVRPCTL